MGPVAAQTTRFFARAAPGGAPPRRGHGQRPLPRAARRHGRAAGRPPATDEAAGPAAECSAPRLIGKADEAGRSRHAKADTQAAGPERDLEHARDAQGGKRLRYAAEVSEPALGKNGEAAGQGRSRQSRSCWGSTRTRTSPASCCGSWEPPRLPRAATGSPSAGSCATSRPAPSGWRPQLDDAWATVGGGRGRHRLTSEQPSPDYCRLHHSRRIDRPLPSK